MPDGSNKPGDYSRFAIDGSAMARKTSEEMHVLEQDKAWDRDGVSERDRASEGDGASEIEKA